MTHISRFPLHPSSGTGIVGRFRTSIRFVRYGCANRPFYHIIVMNVKQHQKRPPIEQLGTYDPIPNKYSERLVSFNFERIQYWLAKGSQISTPVAELLGVAGFFPIHPRTYMRAWRRRRNATEKATLENISEKQAESVN
ncbi:PREDICTED: probable 28S ribosomal protein S16, mitochondrial [Dinoponera quadriceps]|uniref:Small ribosomal subunit protein bS16m n=1 Tax=Dinoponera quadriceps TaxID=609295 RepID=A0A6P3X6N6_DINQU|nr:PREDICTED: probable 28S ribosomal protein S16, mitochondrial [Dinoponera quadriceps]